MESGCWVIAWLTSDTAKKIAQKRQIQNGSDDHASLSKVESTKTLLMIAQNINKIQTRLVTTLRVSAAVSVFL